MAYFFNGSVMCELEDGAITLPPRFCTDFISISEMIVPYRILNMRDIKRIVFCPKPPLRENGIEPVRAHSFRKSLEPYDGFTRNEKSKLFLPVEYLHWFEGKQEALIHGMGESFAVYPERPEEDFLNEIRYFSDFLWEIRITEKRVVILRDLYLETGLEIRGFMDKAGCSFEFIDDLVNGNTDYILNTSLTLLAKGFG